MKLKNIGVMGSLLLGVLFSAVSAGEPASTVVPEPSRLKKFMPSRHNAKLEQAKRGQVGLGWLGVVRYRCSHFLR